jgi:squalene-associated FAD-dependent desaturase
MTGGHCVVVGGGFAGLAAAVRLGRGGARVTVLERRPFLGGRAYSFAHPVTGEPLDNGPHVLMGAYTEALDFLAEIGASAKVALQPRLRVALADRALGVGLVAAPPVPGPLQAPAAMLRYRLLGVADRLRLLAGALRLVARGPEACAGTTVEAALAAVGQGQAARERFWDPLALATLNELPARAAAAPFVAVLRRAFFAGAAAARFALPRVPLSALYTADARRAIVAAGGRVQTGASVVSLVVAEGRVAAVVLRNGTHVPVDAVVLAVPCAALFRLLPPVLADAPSFRALAGIGTSPIVSVHLWLDRRVGWGAPFLGLLRTRTQWLFDGGPTAAGGHRIASVTSGARAWDDAPDDEIAAEVLADARAVVPALGAARETRSLVVRERHATPSLTPEADAVRPPAETPLPNLFLAGDWTRTGLPATIESAVVSGRRAAASALALPVPRRLGRPSAHADAWLGPGPE